jgi:hypothetical protein
MMHNLINFTLLIGSDTITSRSKFFFPSRLNVLFQALKSVQSHDVFTF